MTSPNDFLPADYKAPQPLTNRSYLNYMRLRSALKVFSNLVCEFMPVSENKLAIKSHLLSIALLLGEAEQEEKEEGKQLSIPLDESLNLDYSKVSFEEANGYYTNKLLSKDSKSSL